MPILAGEWGYSSTWKNFDDDLQARRLAREFLVNQWQRIPITIWYDWRDDGDDPKNSENRFGIVRHKYSEQNQFVYDPKPAFDASMTLSKQLGKYHCDGRIRTKNQSVYLLRFSNSTGSKLAAWTTEKSPVEVTIPAAAGVFDVLDLVGKETTATATAEGLKITVDGSVQYLTPRGRDEVLAAATVE